MRLELVEVADPEGAIALDPSRDPLQGHRLERVVALLAPALLSDELRSTEHPQVLGDRRPALRELGGERMDRCRASSQPVEQCPAGGIGDGAKDVLVGGDPAHESVTMKLL